jgi:hypothetical protein
MDDREMILEGSISIMTTVRKLPREIADQIRGGSP